MFNKRIAESWPSGHDFHVDKEFMLDFWPLDLAVEEAGEARRAGHDPVPFASRKPPANEIDLSEDDEWMENEAGSTVMVTRDTEDVPENFVSFSEEDEEATRLRMDALTTEFRTLLMEHGGHSVLAADRASSEFEAILLDVFGVHASVDRNVEELSSLVVDMETLGLLLSKTKYIPDSVKRATLTRAIEDGFETMKQKRAVKQRKLAVSSLMKANANLVAGAENPASRMAVIGKHDKGPK